MDLYKLRKEKGVNQDAVANYLGISRQGYSRYERGDREPDIASIIKLANYFNVTTDVLLGNEKTNNSNTLPQDIIVAISKLSDKECKEACTFIDYLVNKRKQ